jgi:hypothetical protein
LLFKEYRKVGRALTGDFEYTRLLYFPLGDGLGIEVILSDPPRVQDPEENILVAVAVVIGDGIDSESEVRMITDHGGDLDEAHYLGYGAWFWKPIE